MTGALENLHVDADTVEDLAPLQRDVPAADYQNTLGKVALLEDGLARVVLDFVEPVDRWRPGRTSGRNECLLPSDVRPLVGAVDDLDGRVVDQLAVAS